MSKNRVLTALLCAALLALCASALAADTHSGATKAPAKVMNEGAKAKQVTLHKVMPNPAQNTREFQQFQRWLHRHGGHLTNTEAKDCAGECHSNGDGTADCNCFETLDDPGCCEFGCGVCFGLLG